MIDPLAYVPIGRTRSQMLVNVPVNQEIDELEVFLQKFHIDDLIDIFCMSEFLTYKFENVHDRQSLLNTTKFLIAIFDKFEKETYFGELLKELNLESTEARVQFGQTLVLTIFRDF